MSGTLEKVKRKMERLNHRIETRRGVNYYDESKRLLILDERLGVYEDLLPDISFLITTIKSLQTEYADERAAHNEHVTELLAAEKLIASQKEEIQRLSEYLRFYQDHTQEGDK